MQIGWGLNMDKFVRALSAPVGHAARPHQALVNAAYLWALRLSRSLAAHPEAERAFLIRATTHLQASQPGNHSLCHEIEIHLAQAEILLGSYLFATGSGSLETEYHVNGALQLSLSLIMHLASRNCQAIGADEEQELIDVFWHAHNLDRMWAVTNGKPATIQIEGDTALLTVTQFLAGRVDQRYNRNSLSLTVKAVTLCERSVRFAGLPTSGECMMTSIDNTANLPTRQRSPRT